MLQKIIINIFINFYLLWKFVVNYENKCIKIGPIALHNWLSHTDS